MNEVVGEARRRGGRRLPAATATAAVLLAGLAASLPVARHVAAAPAAARTVDVSATADRAEGEEFVAPDPGDPRTIVLGSNQWQPADAENTGNLPPGPSGFTQCGVWSSRDGGRTWSGGVLGRTGLGAAGDPVPSRPPLTLPGEFSDAGNLISADQNIVWDRHGTAYYQCIYSGLLTGDVEVLVFRSTDGGRTWSAPSQAFSERGTAIQIDRSFLAVDRSGGPGDGTLYLAFETMFYQPVATAVYVRSSRDGGRTWGAIHRVDSSALVAQWDPREFPQVGPDGTLHILYDSATFSPPSPQQVGSDVSLVVASSRDGGATFDRSVVAPSVVRGGSPDEAFSYFQEMIGAFAVDPADARRMVVAWPDGSGGGSRLRVRASSDGGATWRDADLGPLAARAGAQDHPALAFLPDGRALLLWRDRACCGGTFADRFEVLLATGAFDGGVLRLGPPLALTDAPQPPTTGHHGAMPSEYMSVAGDATGVEAAWDQMAGTLSDDVFRHVDLAGLPATGRSGGVTSGVAAANPDTAAGAGPGGAIVVSLLAGAALAGALRRRRSAHNPPRPPRRRAPAAP